MIENVYAVILAGGKGERFWPLSTPDHPKPFLELFSDRSLLQQTFDRAARLVPTKNIRLVVGRKHVNLSREQLPQLSDYQIFVEPFGRDTSAAIGYASLHLPQDSLMLIMPADHLIPDIPKFCETVSAAARVIHEHGGPCTFGIKPERAETSYGYVKAAAHALPASCEVPVFPVEQFVEKPGRETAEEYVRHGSYYWNSGIFLWKVSRIQALIQQHLPDLWQGLLLLQQSSPEEFGAVYQALPRISIDFGVMQKATTTVLVPASFAWDDIGTWTALLRVLPVDDDQNLIRGSHVGIDTQNCIIYADSHTMATIGIQDIIIVQRGPNTLICHKKYADRLKELLAKLPT